MMTTNEAEATVKLKKKMAFYRVGKKNEIDGPASSGSRLKYME